MLKRLLTGWTVVQIVSLLLLLTPFGLWGCSSPTDSDPALPHLRYTGESALVTEAEVEFGERAFERQQECVGWVGTLHDSLNVQVFRGPFLCGEVLANGCQIGGKLQVNHSVFEGALGHELIHFFEMKNGHAPDYKHVGSVWAKCDNLRGQ